MKTKRSTDFPRAQVSYDQLCAGIPTMRHLCAAYELDPWEADLIFRRDPKVMVIVMPTGQLISRALFFGKITCQ